MQRFSLLSVLLARCSAQSVCDAPTNCANCMAATQPGIVTCLWSQPPSSVPLPAGSGGSCVNSSSFSANQFAAPSTVGYGYCPGTPIAQGCDGLSLTACFAASSCGWYAPYSEIIARSTNICSDGFCARLGALFPPVNYNSVPNGYTIACPVAAPSGLSPTAIGLIVAAVIIVLFAIPILACTKFGQELLAKCGCSCCTRLPGIFSKRTNLVAGEPSRTPRRA